MRCVNSIVLGYLLKIVCILVISIYVFKYIMIYTMELSFEELDRVQDYCLGHNGDLLRIIHILYDDREDYYVTIVDTDPITATLLYML